MSPHKRAFVFYTVIHHKMYVNCWEIKFVSLCSSIKQYKTFLFLAGCSQEWEKGAAPGVKPSGIYWVGDTISILFSGGLLCLGWEGCGPQEQHLVQETGGQPGSGVTTPVNIHLHLRGGLRVKYCSRGNTGLFKWHCFFVSWTFQNLTREMRTFVALFRLLSKLIQNFDLRSSIYFYMFMMRLTEKTWGWAALDFWRWAYLSAGSVHGADLYLLFLTGYQTNSLFFTVLSNSKRSNKLVDIILIFASNPVRVV